MNIHTKSKKWTSALVLCVSVLALSLCLGAVGYAVEESGEPLLPETVTVSKITGLVADGYTLVDGYWRVGTNGDYAFYQGMSLSDADERITGISVEMSDGSTKTLPIGDYTDDDGTTYTVSKPTTTATSTGTNAADNVVVKYDVQVVVNGDEENPLTAECELNFIADKPYALEWVSATPDTSSLGLTSATSLSDLSKVGLRDSMIRLRLTSGKAGDSLLIRDLLAQNSLAPDGDQLSALIAQGKGTKYNKTVNIAYAPEKNGQQVVDSTVNQLALTCINIAYDDPTGISDALLGTVSTQTTKTIFNFSGLKIRLRYSRNASADVALTDIEQYITSVEFYNADGGVVSDQKEFLLNTTVKAIGFHVEIPTTTGAVSQDLYAEFNVNQKVLDQPTVKDLNPTYKDGGVTVTISDLLEDADNAITKYLNGSVITDNTITFNQGGIYTLKFVLDAGANGDYVWAIAGDGVRDDNDYYVLSYTITVSNAPVDVTLTYADGADREYGDGEPYNRTVSLKYAGAGGSEIGTVLEGSASDNTANTGLPEYELRYFGSGLTLDLTDDEADGRKYTTKRPTALGTYSVYAATGATNKYAAGRSAPVEFTISARKLEADNLTTSKPYTGSAYTVKDFVNINSYRTDGKPMFAQGDTVESVINVPADTFTHVKDSKTISLTLKSSNYVWASGKTSENVTITITKVNMTFGVYQPDLTYGDLVKDNLATLSTSDLQFGVTIDDTLTKYEVSVGGSWATVADATSVVWNAGSYRVTYYTKDKTGGTGGAANNYDYNLPSVTQEFAIKHIQLDKVDITGWSNDADNPYQFGVYGTTHDVTLNNWLDDNTSPVGAAILTSVVTGSNLEGSALTLACGQTKVISLTEAGIYTVTVTLNANYQWNDGTNDPLAFCGKIAKQTVSDVTLSSGVTYDGADHTVNVTFRVGGAALAWSRDSLKNNANIVNISTVKGATLAAEKLAGNVTPNNTDGNFVVKYAGNYNVTLSLADTANYEWSDSSDSSATYTVAQAMYQGGFDYENPYPFVSGAASQSEPNFTMTRIADNDTAQADVTSITPVFTLYNVDFKSIGGVGSVKEAGTFYKVVTDLTSTDYSHLNYFVPEEDNTTTDRKVSVMFVINSSGLDKIVLRTDTGAEINGNNISVVYKHGSYKMSDFIAYWNKYFYGTAGESNYIPYLDITVEGVSGNNPGLTNVKIVGDNVDAYVITIKPAANYEWKDGEYDSKDQELTYYITIEKLAVAIDWNANTLSTTFGTKADPKWTITNKENDDVGINFVYKTSAASTEELASITNAGKYVVVATELTGSDKDNYTLVNATGSSADYVIKKQSLVKPMTNGYTGTFNGETQTTDGLYSNGNSLNKDAFTATVNGKRPSEWFVNDEIKADKAFSTADTSKYAFDAKTGKFTFYNAGYYAVTFTIKDSNNYCWYGDGKEEEFDYNGTGYTCEWDYNFAHIERDTETVIAPRLTGEGYNYRAMEWGTLIPDLSDNVFTGNNVTNITYGVMYGNVSINSGVITYGTASATQAGGIGTVTSAARGEYYALLTINNADDMYNYVWQVDSSDTAGDTYVTRTAYVTYTDKGGSQVYLHYAITASQLPIFYELFQNNYVFGANGAYIGTEENTARIGIDDVLAMTGSEEDKANAATGSVSYAFYLAGTETPYTNIVNGLPWDAGKYDVRVTITFPKESEYSTLTIRTNENKETLTITVDKRDVQVVWSYGEGSSITGSGTLFQKTYNGIGEILTATVGNMPSKDTLGDTAAPTLTLNYAEDGLINANVSGYKFVATLPETENNLQNGEETARQATLVVNKATLHINGVGTTHVYGDPLDYYNKTENYNKYYALQDGEQIYDRDGKVIDITIQTADGTVLTTLNNSNLEAVVGGEYYVVPTLTSAGSGNYILSVAANGNDNKLTVEKRKISVTINGNGQGTTLATSVYGTTPVDINDNENIFSVVATNGLTQTSGIPAGQIAANVIKFSVKADGVLISSKTDAGEFNIICDLLDSDNYELAYETQKYVISKAQITDIVVQGYNGVYNAQDNNILAQNTAKVVNDELDQNALVWWFSTDGQNWTKYTLTNGVANETVRNAVNAKQYYIKVSAGDNFEESASQQITVTVSKAQLSVSVNMTIRFGEHGPDKHGNGGLWYNQSIDDLRTENGIYKVEGLQGTDADKFYKKAGYETDFFYNLNNNTFTYGYKSGEVYVRGNDVGSYTLVFDPNGLECDNYTFVGKDGKLTVIELPVTVTLVESVMTAVYGTHPELLNVSDKYIKSVITHAKSSYGSDVAIDLSGMTLNRFISGITTTALKSSNNVVNTNNVDSYPIAVALVSKNCVWEENGEPTTQYTITQATNKIVTENYTLFNNAAATNVENDFATLANAWTYGDYSSTHVNGYNPSDMHKLNVVELLYKGSEFTITIARGGVSVSGTVAANGDATAVLKSLFDQMHKATDEYGLYAGDYTVTYEMADSQNYKPFTETWYFRVGKQQLIVTPANLGVIYGYGLSDARVTDAGTTGLITATDGNLYPYFVQGLVSHNGNGTLDLLENVVAVTFSSDYAAGYENGSRKDGGYAIKRTLDYKELANNYEINEYQDTSKIVVDQREITIKIDSTLSNSFNLRTFENGKYNDETAQVYRFTLVDGTFAEGDYTTEIIKDGNSVEYTLQSVFVLDSYAFDHSAADLGDNYKTNHAGKYPIYLLQGEHYGAHGLANYNIKIEDTAFSGSDEEKTKVPASGTLSETYGTFTINKSKLDIAIVGPYIDSVDGGLYAETSAERITYDGNHKVFNVPQTGDVDVPVTINYYLNSVSETNKLDEAPINVGAYVIECVVDSPDYEAASSTTTHTIIPRSINIVGGDIADVTFQGKEFENVITFNSILNGVALDEVLKVQIISASGTPATTSTITDSVKQQLTACTAVAGDNSLTITARNAGTYTITVELADNGNFKASNYLFTKGDTSDKYTLSADRTQVTFTRNIAQANLTVNIKPATIQYGTTLENNMFAPAYTMSWQQGSSVLDSEAQEIISAETEKNFFNASGLTYTTNNTVGGAAYRVTDIVGNRYNVTPAGLVAYNFNVTYGNSGELEVIKRDLQIKVFGYGDKTNHATTKYVGQFDPLRGVDVVAKGYLTVNDGYSLVNGNTLGALGIMLSVDGKDVGNVSTYNADTEPYTLSYNVAANDVNKNYNITFVKADGETVIDNGDNGTKPTYLITKAPLTVKPVAQTVEYGRELNAILTDGVAHYWSNSDTRRFVEFDGFVNGENYDGISAYIGGNNNFKFTTNYAPYVSHVGDVITIELDGSVLEFTNYEVTLDSANVTITPRTVTAEVTNEAYGVKGAEVYGEDGDNYHDGIYGKAHNANIAFSGHGNSSYIPVFTLSYSTEAIDSYQTKNAAPTRVGEYTVDVILTANGNGKYDYVFADDATTVTLDFDVVQKSLSLDWIKHSVDSNSATDLNNKLGGYIDAIMSVSRFEKNVRGTITNVLAWTEGDKTDKYIANEDGLTILASNEGTYTVVVELLGTAQHNYRWDDNGADKSCVFYVVTNKVNILNFSWSSWIYGKDAYGPTITVSNNDAASVRYSFAIVPENYNGELSALSYKLSSIPSNAGKYAAKAEYPTITTGSSTIGGDIKYAVFDIFKAEIDVPATPDSVMFNNEAQRGTIIIDRTFIAIDSYSENAVSVIITSAGAQITAIKAGSYWVEFVLADSVNYKWADSADNESATRRITWTITKADNNVITINPLDDIQYGTAFTPVASSTYGGAIAASGIYYAKSATKPAADSELWTRTQPTDRGTYWIKVVAEGTTDYEEAELVSSTSFEITKATLTLTPTGTMVYGDEFKATSDKYSYTVSGLVRGDKEEKVIRKIGEVTYGTVGNPTLNVNDSGYGFVLVTNNGYVVGLEADNYNIVSGMGVLTVTPRSLTVTIGAASSEYGMPVNVQNMIDELLTYSENVIEGNNLNVVLSTTATATSNVGGYVITATYNNSNYNITFVPGAYAITQRRVVIGFADNLGGEYGNVNYVDDDHACSITTKVGNDAYTKDDIGLAISYAGLAYDGSVYAANENGPVNAGNYNISVTCNNANFIIVDTPAHQFVISKKVIDGGKLSFDSVEYTGSLITPIITDNDYNVDGKEIYKVLTRNDLVNAGQYDITVELTAPANYKWASVEIATRTIPFIITKATLRVTPSGQMTYGQQLNQATFTYTVNEQDLLADDDISVINVNNNKVEYLLVNEVIGLLHVKEGGYELTMATDDNGVIGLTSVNYKIVLDEDYGILTVNKREIALEVINSTSVYGEQVVLSSEYRVTSGSVIAGDDIGFTPVRADATNVTCAEYAVTATISNNDYVATEIKAGVHSIVKVRVAVSIHATDGVYGGKAAKISVLSVVTTNLTGNQHAITEELTYIYAYSGTAYGSNTSTDFGSTMPTNAGRYFVNLTGIDNDNYELDTTQGLRSAMFLINQKEINASNLTVDSPRYTGSALKPQVVVPEQYRDMFYESGVLVFEQDNQTFTNVGRHTFTLTLKAEYANNYKWASVDVAERELDFVIVKAANGLINDKIEVPAWVFGNVTGTPQSEAISGTEAKIVYEYSSDGINYSTSIPTLAGDYYVRATIEATDNYEAYTSDPIKFTIEKSTIEVTPTINISSEGIEKNDVYTGSQLVSTIDGFNTKVMDMPKVDNDDPNVIVRVSGGSVMLLAVNAGTYTVRFPLLDADNYKWNTIDGATIENNEVVLRWTINKQKVKLPDMKGDTFYITGNDVTFLPEGYNPAIMEITGNVSGYSGSFKAIVSLKDTDNYEWDDAAFVGKDVEIEWNIVGVNLIFVILISVISSVCVTLAITALILFARKRRKVRAEARAIDRRSKADGWTGEEEYENEDTEGDNE